MVRQVGTMDLMSSRNTYTPALQMEECTLLPKYRGWIPISRSIIVEDEPVLRHIPYIGDDDPEGFLDDLATNYDDVEVGVGRAGGA